MYEIYVRDIISLPQNIKFMKFPINKTNISISTSPKGFLEDYTDSTEIPMIPHPGAFGVTRKKHMHEGIDLYCNNGDEVIAIEEGIVININAFTGEMVGSPWWNNTYCVLIEGKTGVFNYGELIPHKNLKIGMKIEEGQTIGHITTILKEDKGRPMNMLHLELYKHGTKEHLNEWSLQMEQADNLLNPTEHLLEIVFSHTKKKTLKF